MSKAHDAYMLGHAAGEADRRKTSTRHVNPFARVAEAEQWRAWQSGYDEALDKRAARQEGAV